MVQFFDPIVIPPPRMGIFKRLGYRKDITRLTFQQEKETEGYIDEALSLIHLRGAAQRVAIKEKIATYVALEGGEILKSRNLAAFLDNCPEVLLMGATAGGEVTEAIRIDSTGDRLTRGVVLDAAASEMVDAALDWIMGYFRQALRRESKVLMSKRYSAGYGDFLLSNQKMLFRLLQLDAIGVEITDYCILVPEKSVTAVTGIR